MSRLPLVSDEVVFVEQRRGRVYEVGTATLQQAVVDHVVRDAVERGSTQHADVQIRVAQPVDGLFTVSDRACNKYMQA